MHLIYVGFVKASDTLLNYLMLGQTLSEVKMEALKTLGEISYLCHVMGEKMEVTPAIGIGPHSEHHLGYPLFVLPNLTTKVNSFDDLKRKYAFLLNRLRMLAICTLHIWTSTNRIYERLNQLRMEY